MPADRRYLPGTMVLETSWDCGEGWIIVRDCLVMGPWRHAHPGAHQPRPAADRLRRRAHPAAAWCAAWTGRCSSAWTASQSSTTAAARPGGRHTDQGYHQAVIRPQGDRQGDLSADPDLRHQDRPGGAERAGPNPAARGRHPLRRAVLGQPEAAEGLQGGLQAADLDRPPLAALAGPGQLPRSPVAPVPHPQRADAQGPDVRPDRRDRGRRDHVAAGDAARRAELGLPVQLDPGRHVRALGPVHARLRVGGQRLLRVPHRRRRARPRRPPDRLRHRRPVRHRRVRARAPAGIPGRPAGPDRQRRTQPASRTTCGGWCSTRCTCTRGHGTGSTTGSGRWPSIRWSTRSSTGASPTAASGRSAASRSTSPRRR